MNICHCLGELQGLQSSDYFWRCHFTSFNRINRSQMFFKIGVLKNFEIFAGKHPCLSETRFNKVAALKVFSCEYCKNFKNTFFNSTPLVAASNSKLFQEVLLGFGRPVLLDV